MTGNIFNIQKFSVFDGPGIRTTVFFKGCPLTCLWCHNPESGDARREIFFYPQKCLMCSACVRTCPMQCHTISETGQGTVHRFDRSACVCCGACAEVCSARALETVGKTVSVEDVLAEVKSDRVFYGQSGGMTLSGGEPMAQPRFALALCRAAKESGIHTAMETCGWGNSDDFLALLPYVDLFLFDYKCEPADYPALTGAASEPILANLRLLSGHGAKIILRCPIIPGCSDTQRHYDGIAALAATLPGITEVQLEPYHPLGISKAEQLGKTPAYRNPSFLDGETLKPAAARIARICGKPCRVN